MLVQSRDCEGAVSNAKRLMPASIALEAFIFTMAGLPGAASRFNERLARL